MIYIKDKQTNEIKTFEVDNYLQLSKNIRDQYIEITQDEVDSYLLQEAKDTKLAEIKKAKEIDLYLPVEYDGNYFYTSEKANINILGVIGIMEDLNLPAYPWRSLSGQVVNLTLTDFKQLRQLIGSSRGVAYGKEADKTIAVMTASTIEEVNNIKW